MKYRALPRFKDDWGKLTSEEQSKFYETLKDFVKACDAFGLTPGSYRWPAALRVKPMKDAPGIWEMTWSFSGPDGRATFEFEKVSGELRVVWRRVGRHEIYKSP